MRVFRVRSQQQDGQIVVLFALSLVVLLAFGGLLFSGAQALVLRRQLQNAGDAGALAAANLLIQQNGCSATWPTSLVPRAPLVTAAKNAVSANISGYDVSKVNVTCTTYSNYAVQVDLSGTSPSYFGAIKLNPATSSQAVNGDVNLGDYSVVLLDPANLNWSSKRNGCPAFLIGGGITATLEGSVAVNSTCTLAQSNGSGAMNTDGGSSSITISPGRSFRLGGEYNKNHLTLNDGLGNPVYPQENQTPTPLAKDPLGDVVDPLSTGVSLPAQSQSNLCKGGNKEPCTLQPGNYAGGLSHNGQTSTYFMEPGVYVFQGLGFSLGAQDKIFTIPSNLPAAKRTTSFDVTAWNAACPMDTTVSGKCGVMIYNAPSCVTCAWDGSNPATSSKDTIDLTGGATFMLRAYNPAADVANGSNDYFAKYKNILLWQARTPQPTPDKGQPTVSLGGGGSVILSGTVYAPFAKVKFGGSSGGSGGATEEVTLQFIVYDLQLQGNNNFAFRYSRDAFARESAYGLVN